MKLQKMTDFVLEQNKILDTYVNHEKAPLFDKSVKYANFLKQPLKLEMFVPLDEEGNLLEEPEQFKEWIKSDHYFNASESVTHQCRMYKKSKEKVLFEVTSEFVSNNIYDENGFFHTLENVESLIADYNNYNLTLTPNAIKQLGL